MYNGYAILDRRGLAPDGWYIPSIDEFKSLVEFLGGGVAANIKLKSKSGWADKGNGTNSSGFSALPGGQTAGKKFINIGYKCEFFSTTRSEGGVNGYYNCLKLIHNDVYTSIKNPDGTIYSYYDSDEFITRSGGYIGNYYNVRCIKGIDLFDF
jgi:uncharacterized protein (TIGR02145 family)